MVEKENNEFFFKLIEQLQRQESIFQRLERNKHGIKARKAVLLQIEEIGSFE